MQLTDGKSNHTYNGAALTYLHSEMQSRSIHDSAFSLFLVLQRILAFALLLKVAFEELQPDGPYSMHLRTQHRFVSIRHPWCPGALPR